MEAKETTPSNVENVSNCSDILREDRDAVEPHDARQHEKRPKRILHFSDGEIVEYSSEDEIDAPKREARVASVDPKTLNWIPWAWYKTACAGSKILNGCDYVGEALADFLGITSPKYQLEIDMYERMHAARAEQAHRQDLEMGGWSENHRNNLRDETSDKLSAA